MIYPPTPADGKGERVREEGTRHKEQESADQQLLAARGKAGRERIEEESKRPIS